MKPRSRAKHNCEAWRAEGQGCANCNPLSEHVPWPGSLAQARAEIAIQKEAHDVNLAAMGDRLAALDRENAELKDYIRDPFGPLAHHKGTSKHSGKDGHYCAEFDDLWICADCEEYECCRCVDPEAGGDK